MKIKELKKEFDKIQQLYIEKFVEKQYPELTIEELDIDFIDECNVFINDYYFSFFDIKFDIDNNVKKDLIFDYYDELIENDEKKINYPNFVKYKFTV